MRDNRHFCWLRSIEPRRARAGGHRYLSGGAVAFRLRQPLVRVARLDALNLEVNTGDARYHVRAIAATVELLTAASLEPGQPQIFRELKLAVLAFCTAVDAHL